MEIIKKKEGRKERTKKTFVFDKCHQLTPLTNEKKKKKRTRVEGLPLMGIYKAARVGIPNQVIHLYIWSVFVFSILFIRAVFQTHGPPMLLPPVHALLLLLATPRKREMGENEEV